MTAEKKPEPSPRDALSVTVTRPALDDDYWRSVRELFTRDVTAKGLIQLARYDIDETARFFMRGVDLKRFRHLPWFLRLPRAAWSIFVAMAHQLSPARRLVFAIAVPTLALSIFRQVMTRPIAIWEIWLLIAATLIFGLLLLELRDKLMLRHDLDVARQIQAGLVPSGSYNKGGYAVDASMRPADSVGGDYFDIIELRDGGVALAVGDVAGKGMPAALMMASLQGSLHTLIGAGARGTDLMTKLNGHLSAHIPSNRLVTFFYAELSGSGAGFRYINAGHNPPIVLRRQGGVEKLGANAIALGIFPDAVFEIGELSLDPGDVLLLYTDGITEAVGPEDQEYGEDRLVGFLSSHTHLARKEFLDSLRSEVLAFCGPVRPRDDMTLMLVSRES